jgi:hypothetical protein
MLIRKIVIIIISIVFIFGLLGWLGLHIQPQSFPAYSANKTQQRETISLPGGLPKPVEHFYRVLYGDEIPVIKSVVIQGRGIIKPFMNIPIPVRFVFVHNAGKDYRHYFEATLFGIPVIKLNEGYIDKKSFFKSPWGSYYDKPNANQGANLVVWAEAILFPSLWLTDQRVHWEPVNDNTALLYVPYEDGEENFIVRFNPLTGKIDMMESMRYREIEQGQSKILWITRSEESSTINDMDIRVTISVEWLDQGKPWAYFNIEEQDINIDVTEMLNEAVIFKPFTKTN